MGDLLARLQSALGDAYRIEKELGGGGMSRLFLTTEASLHRQVVIKLLPPGSTWRRRHSWMSRWCASSPRMKGTVSSC